LLWLAGFFWFVAESPGAAPDGAVPSDAIIVLTGGRERLHEGMELLREGKGRKLFVSGVNPGVHLGELLRISGNAPSWARCCVVLGHKAMNTRGNAEETAWWMKKEGYKSLRLVTSWYHMPRSLLDFEHAMPKITIIPHPVFSAEIDRRQWWTSARGTLLLFAEYSKYLLALGESPVPRPGRNASRASGGEERARGATRFEVRP
jgi:uncharacterized SAM-binding protein YcdF (DUF218 family)